MFLKLIKNNKKICTFCKKYVIIIYVNTTYAHLLGGKQEKMRPLEDVTGTSVKNVLSFAARALAVDRISPQQYDEIRRSALAMQEVVNSAIGESSKANKPVKVIQRRKRNSQIAAQIQASQMKKDMKEVRMS